MTRARTIAGLMLALASMVIIGVSGAETAHAGAPPGAFVTSDFVSNLPDAPPTSPYAGVGPIGLAFDSSDHLLISDAVTLGLYSVGPAGSPDPQPISTNTVQGGLTFAKTGQLFGVQYQAGNLVQIDPSTGTIVRQLNPPGTSYPCIFGLTTDPVSGDLFFSEPDSGGVCPGSTTITRVENPTSPDPTFTTYLDLASASADGLAFGPGGSLYAVIQSGTLGCATRISGTAIAGSPSVTRLACITGPGDLAGIDALTVSARPHGEPTLYIGGPTGTIWSINQSVTPATVTAVVTGGTAVDALTVGPDGCLYATQSTTIVKVTRTDGNCSLVPATVLPSLDLRPDTVNSVVVGTSVNLAATLRGVDPRAGSPVTFTVTGANQTSQTVTTDRSGRAEFSYRGTNAGTDTVTARATEDSTPLTSNPSTVRWQAP
jgi:hypothetical protein